MMIAKFTLVVVLVWLVLLMPTSEACSPPPAVKKAGVFVHDVVRPLLGYSDNVLARLGFYSSEQPEQFWWEPLAEKEVLVNLDSGRACEVSADKTTHLTPPSSLDDLTGGFALSVNAHLGETTSPTATLKVMANDTNHTTSLTTSRAATLKTLVNDTNRTTSITSSPLNLYQRPDGTEIASPQDSMTEEEWMMNENLRYEEEAYRQNLARTIFYFYSPSFDLVYVFYEKYGNVTVTTFHGGNLTKGDTFFAVGWLNYERRWTRGKTVYDGVQVLELERDDMCGIRQFAYYNRTSVVFVAENIDLLEVISSVAQDHSATGTLVTVSETRIGEYLTQDPQTVLREVTINAADLEALFSTSGAMDQNAFMPAVSFFFLVYAMLAWASW